MTTAYFLLAIALGLIVSIPLGPSGISILSLAISKQKVKSLWGLSAFILADIIIASLCIVFFENISDITQSPFAKFAAGIFLLIFALKPSKEITTESLPKDFRAFRKVFQLTFTNPAIWIGMIAVLSLIPSEVSSSLWGKLLFLGGFEIGAASWYLALIFGVKYINQAWQMRIQKIALYAVAAIGLYYVAGSVQAFAAPIDMNKQYECKTVESINNSERLDCQVKTDRGDKTMHVLKLKGSYEEVSYDHGYLMGLKAEEGILEDTIVRIEEGLNKGSLAAQQVKKGLFQCYQRRIKNSVSLEFLRAVDQIAMGIDDKLLKTESRYSKYSFKQYQSAALAISLSITMEGLERRMEIDPTGTSLELTATCGLTAPLHLIQGAIEGLAKTTGTLKLGCLGFTVPKQLSQNGKLMHARNLDANMVKSWNKAPTVFLVEETGYHKYVAAGTAGLIYMGGISGFNEKGISVSTHEMSTTHYRTYAGNRKGVLGPFMLHRILREAATLDEAIKLVKKSRHFGSWTFLVSDAKSNETASIEVAGNHVQVARRTKDLPMGQSNHFLGSKMKDKFYFYSFNKLFESKSRLKVVSEAMNNLKAPVDSTWMIDQLSNHTDAFEGFRSFGRTAVKAYNVMSTIAVPGLNQLLVTLSERTPAAHSSFLSFNVDFNKFDIALTDVKRTKQYAHIPNWEDSLHLYSDARVAYKAGEHIMSLLNLNKAIQLSMRDGIDEQPYNFMRARVLNSMGEHDAALYAWNKLWDKRDTLHPYHQSLVGIYTLYTLKKLGNKEPRDAKMLHEIEKTLTALNAEHEHFDLAHKMTQFNELKQGHEVKIPDLDFVTVE